MKTLPSLTIVLTASVAAAWVYSAQPKAKSKSKAEPAKAETKAKKKPAAAAGTSDGDAIVATATLQKARQKLTRYKSIRAQIIETVAIRGRRFKVTGHYLQGELPKLRLEFKIQLGYSEGSVLEVCDGKTLWTRRTIGRTAQDTNIIQRDIRQILKEVAKSRNVPENALVADLGLGGLPGLLASIERMVAFESQKGMQIDDQQFTVIEGTWKSEYARNWRTQGAATTVALPDYVPDRIRIYFDAKSLFPRRILYLKIDPQRKKVYRPMVTLDFDKVEWDVEVDEREFVFTPPEGVYPKDVTQDYLKLLRGAATGKQ